MGKRYCTGQFLLVSSSTMRNIAPTSSPARACGCLMFCVGQRRLRPPSRSSISGRRCAPAATNSGAGATSAEACRGAPLHRGSGGLMQPATATWRTDAVRAGGPGQSFAGEPGQSSACGPLQPSRRAAAARRCTHNARRLLHRDSSLRGAGETPPSRECAAAAAAKPFGYCIYI